MEEQELEYAGFWIRLGACLLDTLLFCVITFPPLVAIYGWSYFQPHGLIAGPADFLISWVMPMVAIIALWICKQATPGKIAISARIVDAQTGEPLSIGQSIIRYFGYFVSIIPFFLGFIWIALDNRKQGWHDKMAGSVVVRERYRPDPERFSRKGDTLIKDRTEPSL